MTNSPPDFELIETLRWQRSQGFYLLERHLARLAKSAGELGFECCQTDVLNCLNQAIPAFSAEVERVRLLLSRDGRTSLTHTPIELPDENYIMLFAISDKTTHSSDSLYRHKTTRRELYDGERVRLQKITGCTEVVFTNERGEITEGSITTIFLEKDGVLKTPPVASGVLPGTLRAQLLDDTAVHIREVTLTLADLKSADRIYLGNSVRGLIKARQVKTRPHL